jgi:hypothetical protein
VRSEGCAAKEWMRGDERASCAVGHYRGLTKRTGTVGLPLDVRAKAFRIFEIVFSGWSHSR